MKATVMESPPIERQTYDLSEFAQIMGISFKHAINLAVADELPGVIRLGRRWLITKEAVDGLLKGTTKGNAQ